MSPYVTTDYERGLLACFSLDVRGFLDRESRNQPSTHPDTPSTSRTDLSANSQESPASSQTSSNIVDDSHIHISPSQTTTMPPKPGAGKGRRVRSTPAPDTAIHTTKTRSDRPGRNRKPTHKAAELAANQSSNLFKSGKERQLSNDTDEVQESFQNGAHSPSTSSNSGDEVEASVSPKKTTLAPARKQHVAKPTNPSPTAKTGRRSGARKAAKGPISETSAVSKKRKHTAEPEDPKEAPTKKIKTADTRAARSKSKTPASETAVTIPTPAQITKPAKSTRKRKQTEQPEEPEEATSKKTKRIDTRLTRSKSKPPAVEISTITSTPPPDDHNSSTRKRKRNTITTISREPPQATPNKDPSPPPPPSVNPPRLKFKPLKVTIDSAREGATGLPCALSCLNDEQLFYMWAQIVAEHEELADEVVAWGGFDSDTSGKACALRRRWNAVLAGFCGCRASAGFVNGRGAEKGKRKAK